VIFWGIAGILMTAAVLALIAPLARHRPAAAERAEHGLEVLRDQLAEVERDRDSGRLDAASASAARLEIERLLLAEADRRTEVGAADISDAEAGRRRRFAAVVLVLLTVPVGATGIYLVEGRPGLPDAPLASRSAERAQMSEIGDRRQGLAEMAANLDRRLGEQPNDIEGWMLLGRTRLTLGQSAAAVEAFRRATLLAGGDPQPFAHLGEALVRAGDGVVGEPAREAFFQALERMPGEPRSRFYLGLANRQAGNLEEALEWWVSLEADSPNDAAWRQILSARIQEAASEGGIDVDAMRDRVARDRSAQPPAGARGPTAEDVAAARDMPTEDRLAMIQGMVDSLAERLEADPTDIDGWRRLGRSYLVLNRRPEAVEAYRRAAEQAPDEIEVLLDYAHALFPPGTSEREMPPAFAQVIDRVRALQPDNAEALFFGGVIAARRGDNAQARELWSLLIDQLPEGSPVRVAVEKRLSDLPTN